MCTPEVCMAKIAEGVNRALAETSGVCVVLENVAGQARRFAWRGQSRRANSGHWSSELCAAVAWQGGLALSGAARVRCRVA
jgi:hypothetical protein